MELVSLALDVGYESLGWSFAWCRQGPDCAAAGAADDEISGKGVVTGVRLRRVEHDVNGRLRDRDDGLAHDRERWPAVLGLLAAVERDEADVLGHPDAGLVQGCEDADGRRSEMANKAPGSSPVESSRPIS